MADYIPRVTDKYLVEIDGTVLVIEVKLGHNSAVVD